MVAKKRKSAKVRAKKKGVKVASSAAVKSPVLAKAQEINAKLASLQRDEEDALVIDSILATAYDSSCLHVNREKFTASHEAWVYVTIHHPADAPNGWEKQPGYTIYGFSGKEGIITWENSD